MTDRRQAVAAMKDARGGQLRPGELVDLDAVLAGREVGQDGRRRLDVFPGPFTSTRS